MIIAKIYKMKIGIAFFTILSAILIISCSPERVKYNTYSEPSDPNPGDIVAWSALQKGIHASVGSIDKRYKKSTVPQIEICDNWKGIAWKGKKVNAQLLLWTSENLNKVHCVVSDLKDGTGNKILAENINTFFVRYIITDEFAGGCGHRKPADFDSSLVADALDPIPYFDIEANSARPVWVTIKVPHKAVAGTYSGNITIKAKRQKEVVFNIQLEVLDKVLPEPADWAFHLDLWQNPFAVARFNKVEVWSQQHFNLLRPLMKMLAKAGQKCITASIIHKPWGGQTYDHFESLIKWAKNENGTWSYDFTDFDNWIELAMDCGITAQINCYTMIPWGNRFTYFDELIEKETTVTALTGTIEYEKIWTPFLQKFTTHLNEKEWQNITTIAMDERKSEDMQKMITFIKSIAPELKITLAGGYHEKINNDLYDLCVASEHIIPKEDIIKRSEKGFHTTYYVCCIEPYPNNFTFSPPAESAYMGWYAASKGYSGFLRWAYNSWVENPLTDSRFRAWPAGDTYFVYPGGRSSIRFERLLEGIQDFEKIQVLRSELEAANNVEANMKLQKLEEILSVFEISDLKDTPAHVFVNRGKDLLIELTRGCG